MKHRLVRALALAPAASLALSACSAAGGVDASGDATGKVTLWMYPVIQDPTASKAFWAKAKTDFEKANPGIDLTIELQTFDKRDEQITAALAAGSGPDIVLITPDQAATYLSVGGLLPVDDAIAKERDSFYPATLKAATFDDKLYGVPIFQNISTTSYNTAAFKDAGLALPTTWDEVLADAPKLADRGVSVLDYVGSPEQTLNLTFYPFLWQAGGHVFSKNGKKVAFDSAAGQQALEFLVKLQKMGGLPSDAATQGAAIEGSPFAAGKVGVRNTTMLPELSQMRSALGEDAVELGVPLTGKVQAAYGNPGLLALTSINKSQNRAAAYRALSFLSSASFQTELNKAASNFPTRKDVALQGSGPDYKALAAALKVANPGESNAASRQVMAVLAPYIQSALRGDMSPKQALAKAAAEAQAVLDRS